MSVIGTELINDPGAPGGRLRRDAGLLQRLPHRRDADRIVVLDDDRIVKSGTHDDLVEADGLYANLRAVQACQLERLPATFLERAKERGTPGVFDETGNGERGES